MQGAIIYDAVDKLHVVGHVAARLNSLKSKAKGTFTSLGLISCIARSFHSVAIVCDIAINVIEIIAYSLCMCTFCVWPVLLLLAARAPDWEKAPNSDPSDVLFENTTRFVGLLSRIIDVAYLSLPWLLPVVIVGFCVTCLQTLRPLSWIFDVLHWTIFAWNVCVQNVFARFLLIKQDASTIVIDIRVESPVVRLALILLIRNQRLSYGFQRLDSCYLLDLVLSFFELIALNDKRWGAWLRLLLFDGILRQHLRWTYLRWSSILCSHRLWHCSLEVTCTWRLLLDLDLINW